MTRRCSLALVGAACLLAACGDGSGGSGNGGGGPPVGGGIESIVVLGDSVASGEGINYGYTYSYNSFFNSLSRWTGGTDNPTWQGQYQLCHQSALAYGDVLAASLGPEVLLSKFACTGSTFVNGIAFDRRAGGMSFRPAQFGDWLSMQRLNPDYDAAKPDLVIITLGADDLSFVSIVEYCATGYTLADAAEVEAIAALRDPRQRIRANFLRKFPTLEAWQDRPARSSSDYCVANSPGAVIESLFWDPINSGEIAAHYIDLVKAIQARGEKAGKVPRIVFTTYHNPLPSDQETIGCYDLGDFSRAEIDYLSSLMGTINDTLKAAVAGMEGVTVVDISGVMDGHKYCSEDPWTYGLTVLLLDKDSQAPFHPTSDGQAAIAALIKQALETDGQD